VEKKTSSWELPMIIRGVKAMWRQTEQLLVLGYGFLCYIWALVRNRKSWIVEEWDGERDLESACRIAVFSHFDRYGIVHDYVYYYLQQLAGAGYTILFVSSAPKLSPEAVAILKPLCCMIIRRKNVGYDFAAYKEGIARIPRLERLEALILANDSVYGPFIPLHQVLDQADPEVSDVWSMTDSWQHSYHLQSYFLLFYRSAIVHSEFGRFWRSVHFVQSKAWVIRFYEVGLSKTLLAAGLSCRALFPYRKAMLMVLDFVRESGLLDKEKMGNWPEHKFIAEIYSIMSSNLPLNPTHFFWYHLIGRMGFPFLKRELLEKNPARIPALPYWEREIKQVSDYDTDLIIRHLKRSLRNRSV